MSVFGHAQGIKTLHAGEGGKKWQNSVQVVVECPLNGNFKRNGPLKTNQRGICLGVHTYYVNNYQLKTAQNSLLSTNVVYIKLLIG